MTSAMLSYLKERVEAKPGIKVSKLPGHMAQLPAKVRAEHGANEIAIRNFIQKHPEVFKIDKDDGVFVRQAVAKDVTSGVMLSHLKKCLEANQGIKTSELPGYLDELPAEVREKHGANESVIRRFVEKHSEVFVIDSSDRVFIRAKVPATTELALMEDLTELRNVSGEVIRIISAFGFIAVKQPIKTTVYFGVKQFEDGCFSNMLSSGLKLGDTVVLDATRTFGHTAQFRATHVSRIEPAVVNQPPQSKPPKVKPESDEDHLYNQSGVIHTVKPGYGFITFGPKKKNCSFFHGSIVDKTVTKSRRNLADIFTVGDKVRFDAVPDCKPSKWVKWKATRVWCGPPEEDDASDPERDSGDEVFMSEDEEDIEGLFNGGSLQDLSDVEIEDYPVGCPDWEDPKESSVHGSSEPSNAKAEVQWTARRKLSGIKGAFFRVTESAGLAFWLDEDIFVRVVIDVVYHKGKQVKSFEELYEESTFHRAVDVFFDAVKVDKDLWVATLMWTGDRPAKLHVNHSENIFNSVLAKTMREEFTAQHSTEGTGHSSPDAPLETSAVPSESQPSVTICPDRKGVVSDVQQRVATCNVREFGNLRELRFTCFYKDGTAHMYNLDQILKKGDTVSLDYMVGVSRGKEEVHCDLVWQGQKPSAVLQLSPEDFVERLSMPALQRSITPPASAMEQPVPYPPNVCGVKQDGSCEPLRTAQPLEASAIVINAAGQQLTATALHQRLPGATIAPVQSVVRSANVGADKGGERTSSAPEIPQREAAEPSVFIYESAKGTIVRALESVAWAEVKDGKASWKVEFTSGCFYKDGELVMEDLNEVLAKGDDVTLDYMIGRTSRREVVRCDVVWQGRKPQAAPRLGPDEFARKLNITGPAGGVVAAFDDFSSRIGQQRDDMPENNQAVPTEPRLTRRHESIENESSSSSLPKAGTSSNEPSCEQAGQVVVATSPAATGAVDAADPTLPTASVDVLLRFVTMVTEQLRIEFRDELRRALESCMEPTRIAVQDSMTQTDDPPPASLSGELTPPFFSPCSSPDWCLPSDALLPSESCTLLHLEVSRALRIGDDDTSQSAETSRELLAADDSVADISAADISAAVSHGALTENEVLDLLEISEDASTVAPCCQPVDPAELPQSSLSAVQHVEHSDTIPEGNNVL